MTYSSIQTSLVSGEMSPSLFGRVDLAKYHNGCSTMRNFFVNYRGGASSRAGWAYVGKCKQPASAAPPRDINFQFNLNQGYALEFGDQYMRVKSNGAYVVEAAKNIVGSSRANPGIIGVTGHGFSIGEWIYIQNMVGMTEYNGLTWIVNTVPNANTFTVTDLFGNVVNSTNFGIYVSGGTAARIYTAVSPYAAVDLPYLKFTQSKDTMSLACVNQDTTVEYPTYELTRFGLTNWVFSAVNFGASIAPPTGVSATAQSSTTLSTWYSYLVTSIDSATGEESVASTSVQVQNNNISINAGSNTISWTPVPGASSYNIYKATPSYSVGVPMGSLYGYMGTAFGTQITDSNITADFVRVPPNHNDPFAPAPITSVTPTASGQGFTQDTIGYTITTSTGTGFMGNPVVIGDSFSSFIITNGGRNYAPADTITIGKRAIGTYTFTGNPTAGQTIVLNGVTWSFVTTTPVGNQTLIHTTVADTVRALVENLNTSVVANLAVATYTFSGLVVTIKYDAIGTSGNAYTLAAGTYAGTVSGATLTGGSSGSATAILTVGAATGNNPGVVQYYQQRRGYAYTLNKPDTYFFSKPGLYKNFDTSIPSVGNDAIIGNPWAQQVNGIQFMTPMTTGMIILTGNGAWLLNGGNDAGITPANQTANPQAYNGSSAIVPPLVVNYDMLYVQSKGSIVRDLSFNFYVNVFTGTDMTVISNHLFNYHQIQQWAYAEEPYKLIWCVRDDGIMICLTYLKDQEVIGWSRHDTNGLVVGVCSVTEPPVDAVYTITKRYIVGQNQWAYYSERMDNRNWPNAEDCFCVDAGLSYGRTYPNATLIPAAAEGTNNISSVNLVQGGSNYTAPIINAVDPTGEGTGATFSVGLTSGVITSVTILTQGQNYAQGTTLNITDSTGSGGIVYPIITNIVQFNTSANVFSAGNVGDVIRIGNNNAPLTAISGITATGGGKAVITSYVSATRVLANIIDPITNVLLNNPENMPVPVSPDQWSIATPTDTVTGLNHLEGMEVAILADGSVVANQVVDNGSVTLPYEASAITIGLPFIAQVQTLYFDAQIQGGTMQGKRKDIYAVTIRMEKSRGMQVGTNQPDQSVQPNNATIPWTNMKEFKERNATIKAGNAIPLFTGDERILVPGSWDTKGQVAVQQTYPLPANIEAIIPEYQVGDTPG